MRNTAGKQLNIWKSLLAFGALAACLFGSALSASAASLAFSVNGTNAATGTSLVGWANFVYDATAKQLTLQVINGSGVAMDSSDALTAIFWNRGNTSAALTPVSAKATGSSILWNPKSNQTIGDYWQFKTGILGPDTTNEGISSNPFSIFNKGNFGSNPGSLGNMNGAITNGMDASISGNLKSAFSVQNEVTYTFTTGATFSLDDFQSVYFQFGNSLSGPRLLAKLSVPEPGTIALLASMGSGSLMVGLRRVRRRRAK